MPAKKIPLAAATRVSEPLTEEDLQKLVAPGLGTAARPVLDSWGYNGGAAAFIGLSLDSTNQMVEDGNLYLLGQLYSDGTVLALSGEKLWESCPSTTKIQFSFENLAVFQFRGSLCSELIALETVEPVLLVDNKAVGPDAFKAAGGGDACLRATVFPETHDFVRLTVTVFPTSRAEFRDMFTNRETGGVPGARLVSELIPVVPNKIKKWGLGFLPLLAVGNAAAVLPLTLVHHMKKAVHKILSKGVKPVGASSAASVAAKWESMKGPNPIQSAPLPFTWTIPAEFADESPIDTQGESAVYI